MDRFRRTAAATAMMVALAIGTGLTGCDRFRNFTDQEHVQRAKDFQAKGDLRASEIELKNALSKNPNNVEARLVLAELYLTLRQGSAAEKELKQAQKLGAGIEALKLPLARAYLLQHQPERVLDEVDVSDQTSARNAARILALRGDALLGARRFRDACHSYEQALAADEANAIEARWGLAFCAAALRDLEGARKRLEEARQIDPANDATWARIGELEQVRGDLKAAEQAYTEAIRLDPKNVEALIGRAGLRVRSGRTNEAAADAKQLRNSGIDTPGMLYVDALISLARKEPRKSLEAVQLLEKAYPQYFPAWLLAAQLHFANGTFGLAEQYVDRYLALQPADLAAVRLKAQILMQSRRAAEAPELLKPLLQRFPNDPQLLTLIGQSYTVAGHFDKAREYLEKAAAAASDNVAIQIQLGGVYAGAGMTDQAAAILAAASAADPLSVQADLLLVANYNRAKQYDKALAAIAALEKKQPNNILVSRLRAATYALQNDVANARLNLERVMAAQPTDMVAATALADLDMRDNKPEAARDRFLGILAKDGSNVDAMIALARLAAAGRDEAGYVQWLRKAADASPKALQARALLAEHHLAKGNPQQALVVANEAYTANRDNPAALELLGRVQLAAGELENAAASFTRLVSEAPRSVSAHVGLARAHIALKRYQDARSTLRQALALEPRNIAALEVAAHVELMSQRSDEAARYAQQILEYAPKADTGHVLRGDILTRQRKFAEAAQSFETALALEKRGATMVRLHQALILGGRASEGDRRIQQWLQDHPADDAVRVYFAESNVVRGQVGVAIEQFHRVLQRHPDHVPSLNNLALLYQQAGDPRALALAEQASKLSPDDPKVMDTLGWVLVNQGDARRGLVALRQAVAKLPNEPAIRYHYAVALARAGDKVQARRELDLVVKDRNFSEKQQALELLKTL